MAEKQASLQDVFLNSLRKAKTPVTMFLVKGVKLQGIVTWFDNFSVLLRRDGQSQLIYKHAISTIMPAGPIDLAAISNAIPPEPAKKQPMLQDVFLNAVRKSDDSVTMFLVNGVMLQGHIVAFDLFCMLLLRDGMSQLVYKHAVSTIQPARPLNLAEEQAGSEEGLSGSGAGFERDRDEFARGAKAIVVYPELGGSSRDAEARLAETAGLAAAIGVEVVGREALRVRAPRAATLIGSGQVEALAATGRMEEAELFVFDATLTPIQQRNLETGLGAKVLDRTGLILEIFGERAATAEGRLQVELAHLDYQAGRLVRSWTHLERQRGGFGFLGGPGETQIEADRRLIRDRMARLKRELDGVTRTRGLHRERRQRAPWPVIALVGYTNAGKSTLFNRLTGSDVMAENLLFATLDPTLRQISLPGIDKAILSDTVGFVSELPTQLVAAFKATLEEVVSADLLIHVRDVAHPDTLAQKADVEGVLAEIGVAETTPVIEAWNKLDLLGLDEREELEGEAAHRDDVVAVSALTGEGVDELVRVVSGRLTAGHVRYTIMLDAGDGAGAAWLHQHGEVLATEVEGDQAVYEVRLSLGDFERFAGR